MKTMLFPSNSSVRSILLNDVLKQPLPYDKVKRCLSSTKTLNMFVCCCFFALKSEQQKKGPIRLHSSHSWKNFQEHGNEKKTISLFSTSFKATIKIVALKFFIFSPCAQIQSLKYKIVDKMKKEGESRNPTL